MVSKHLSFIALASINLAVLVAPANATVYDLRMFQVDDDMNATISNTGFTNQIVMQRSFTSNFNGDAAQYANISEFIRPGLNSLKLSLFNTRSGYTYGYDFRIDGISYASGKCGNFNIFGCDNDSYAMGLVWSRTIDFVDGVPPTTSVPDAPTWLSMIAGFSVVGLSIRRARVKAQRHEVS